MKMKVKSAWFVFLCLLVAVSVPATALGVIHEVTVGDNFFSPSELTIQPGDTVRWVNAAGGAPHNVTSNDDAWTASETDDEFIFEVVFNDPGQFPYRCTIHSATMTGTITVAGAVTEPELEVQSVNATNGSYAPGDTLNIATSIMNSGTAGSGSFVINFYAFDPNDRNGDQPTEPRGRCSERR